MADVLEADTMVGDIKAVKAKADFVTGVSVDVIDVGHDRVVEDIDLKVIA